MTRYVRAAVDDRDENEHEARGRAKALEQAGRLRDDGSPLPVHQDEAGL